MLSRSPLYVLGETAGFCLAFIAVCIAAVCVVILIGRVITSLRQQRTRRKTWIPPVVTPDVRTEFERVVSRYDVISIQRCTVGRDHYAAGCNGYHITRELFYRK